MPKIRSSDYLPFYGDDIFGDRRVMRMTAAGVDLYMRAMWMQYVEGWVPDDPSEIAQYTRMRIDQIGAAIEAWPDVRACFAEQPDGSLINEECATYRDQSAARIEAQTKNGRKGGRPRKVSSESEKGPEKPKQNPRVSKTETQTKPTGSENRNPNESQPKPRDATRRVGESPSGKEGDLSPPPLPPPNGKKPKKPPPPRFSPVDLFDELPEHLQVSSVREALESLDAYRREKNLPLWPPSSFTANVKAYSAVSAVDIVDAVGKTIAGGWTGCFPKSSPKSGKVDERPVSHEMRRGGLTGTAQLVGDAIRILPYPEESG